MGPPFGITGNWILDCLLLTLYIILDQNSMLLNLCLNPLVQSAIKCCRVKPKPLEELQG